MLKLPASRALAISGLAGLALLASGCGSTTKSSAQLANDLLTAGLRAQAAGSLSEAQADYQQAVQKDPKNKIAYYDLALVYQLSGRNDLAESNYRAALQLDPNFEGALFNLAIIRSTVDPQEAETLYRHVIAVDANSAGAHLNLGFLLRGLNRPDEAAAEFAKAVRIDPTLANRVPSPSPSPSHR